MNFIDYCLYTKNYSALNTVKNYTRLFAFNQVMTQAPSATGANDYNQRLEKAVSDWRIEQKRQGNASAARMPLDITSKKRILAEMEKRTQPRQVSNFARLSI